MKSHLSCGEAVTGKNCTVEVVPQSSGLGSEDGFAELRSIQVPG